MTNRAFLQSLGLVLILAGCRPIAQEPTTDEYPAPFLEDVTSWVVTAAASGREFQISVALPFGYADSTAKSYPVLYATDANGHFGTVVEAARMLRIGDPQIPQLIIVGIGYPTGGRQLHAAGHRRYDLTPGRDLAWEQVQPSGGESGGGTLFLQFIREELFPVIDAKYRTDPSDRAIYGHSSGGLFAVYALLAGEGAFQRAIAASPSFWFGSDYIFGFEESYAQTHDSLEARLFLSMGMDEPDDARYGSGCCFAVTKLRRFADILEERSYEGLAWHSHVFEGENHQSVVPAGISRGLRYIYEPESVADTF